MGCRKMSLRHVSPRYYWSYKPLILVNQFVNPLALEAIGWRYYGVYVGVLVLFFIGFYFTIRETRGLTVEDAANVYGSSDERAEMLEAERQIQVHATARLAVASTERRKSSESESTGHAECRSGQM
jgi:hypothetical protein